MPCTNPPRQHVKALLNQLDDSISQCPKSAAREGAPQNQRSGRPLSQASNLPDFLPSTPITARTSLLLRHGLFRRLNSLSRPLVRFLNRMLILLAQEERVRNLIIWNDGAIFPVPLVHVGDVTKTAGRNLGAYSTFNREIHRVWTSAFAGLGGGGAGNRLSVGQRLTIEGEFLKSGRSFDFAVNGGRRGGEAARRLFGW